jgi:hypothetical protein
MLTKLVIQADNQSITIRLENIAEKLILQTQIAFMKRSNIMTRIMALHEVMHETKRTGKTGIVLKLDFEKAYDKVCWDFHFEGRCDWIKAVVIGGCLCENQ